MLTNSPSSKKTSSKQPKKKKHDTPLQVDTDSRGTSDGPSDSPTHLPTPPAARNSHTTGSSGNSTPQSARKGTLTHLNRDAVVDTASSSSTTSPRKTSDGIARANSQKAKLVDRKSSQPVRRRTVGSSDVILSEAALKDASVDKAAPKTVANDSRSSSPSRNATMNDTKKYAPSSSIGNKEDAAAAAAKNDDGDDSDDDSESDISSDEDGDFAAITAGVVDPEKYHALRQYFVKYRQQEKMIAHTVKEVDQLANKQRRLLQKAHQKQRELDRSNVRIKNMPTPPLTPSTLQKSSSRRPFNTVPGAAGSSKDIKHEGNGPPATSSSCDSGSTQTQQETDAAFQQLTSKALKSFISRKEERSSRAAPNGISVGLDDSLDSSFTSVEVDSDDGRDEPSVLSDLSRNIVAENSLGEVKDNGNSKEGQRSSNAHRSSREDPSTYEDGNTNNDDTQRKSQPFQSMSMSESGFPTNSAFLTTQAPGASDMRAVAAQLRAEMNDADKGVEKEPLRSKTTLVQPVKSFRNLRKEVIDAADDEFEDLGLKTDRCVPFRQDFRSEALNYEKETKRPSANSEKLSEQMHRDAFAEDKHLYRTGAPSVKGEVSAVFDNGMLYKIVTEDGAWAFFNDTEQYEMQVRFIFGASSEISKGPRVVDRTIRGGRHEYKLQVKPCQTEVLIAPGSCVNGFRNLSVATPLPVSFHSRNTRASREEVNKELLRIMESSVSLTEAPSRAQQDETAALTVSMEMGYPFIDPTFPPLSDSIYRPREDFFPLPAVPWYRPEMYISNVLRHILAEEGPSAMSSSPVVDCRLFRGRILPEDVSFDSDLAPRYLISAMAALAEYPALIRMLFKHPVSATAGKAERSLHAYRVNLMCDGWWKTTLVDDYVPASLRGPMYALCASDLQKLWVPLLEKAVAKARGSYSSMMSGDVLESLQELTGFPTYNFVTRWEAAQQTDVNGTESSALFHSITEFLRSRALVVLTAGVALEEMSMVLSGSIQLTTMQDVSTNDTVSDTKDTSPARTDDTSSTIATMTSGPVSALKSANAFFEQNGLTRGMSYAVIRVVEDPVSGIRLVKLRNPWFALPWVRGWSFDDPRWDAHPNLRVLCQVDETSYADGVWLAWNDIVRHFCGGGVLLPPRSGLSTDVRVRGTFEYGVPNVVLNVKCSVPVTAYVSLSQCDNQGRWSRQSMSTAGNRNSIGSFLSNADPSSVIAPLLLCVVRNSDEVKRMYTLDMCSTANPHEPRPKMGFVTSRDVSMKYTFDPKDASSFYIVPRVYYCNHIMKSYVLGLVLEVPSDSKASTSGKKKSKGKGKDNKDAETPKVSVSFEKLASECGVYKNVRRFSTSSVADSSVVCDYQIRDKTGRISSHNGSGFSF